MTKLWISPRFWFWFLGIAEITGRSTFCKGTVVSFEILRERVVVIWRLENMGGRYVRLEVLELKVDGMHSAFKMHD